MNNNVLNIEFKNEFHSRMKILITGASGFLGSVLRDKLSKNYSVIPLSRVIQDNHIQCDISDPVSLLTILNKYNPHVIVNCAAKIDFSSDNMYSQYQTNAVSVAIIAGWCAKNNASLLQTSGSIVNPDATTNFNVRTIERPNNHYGKTKLLADNAIKASGCNYTIIRFGGIFGKGGPNHLGINGAITLAINGSLPTIIGKGDALRNYIHVQDAADLLIYCIENNITGLHYAGNHQHISIANMLIEICSVYLNGVTPLYKSGPGGINQITEVSYEFPQTMSFKAALEVYK